MQKFNNGHDLMHQPREEFRGLSFDQVLQAIQIDLNHHRTRVNEINRTLAINPNLGLEERTRLGVVRDEHKRAITRIEARKRFLLFGDAKR